MGASMDDLDQPESSYIDLPTFSGPASQIPRLTSSTRVYTPSMNRDRQTGRAERQTGRGELEDSPVLPALKSFLMIAEPRNAAGNRELTPERLPEPSFESFVESETASTPEQDLNPISQDSKPPSLMTRSWARIAGLKPVNPFSLMNQYFVWTFWSLVVILPPLLLAIGIWAYLVEDPMDRIEKAVAELRKNRNEARPWTLF